MKEIADILAAAKSHFAAGRKMALATVVGVEGSAYRRPGARMLIAENRQNAGGVSGGCLERDVVEHALLAIARGACSLIAYDTTQDDDLIFGAGLGCRGIVRVFIEPINALECPALELLRRVLESGVSVVSATVIEAGGTAPAKAGMRRAFHAIDETPMADDVTHSEHGGMRRAFLAIDETADDELWRAISDDAAFFVGGGKAGTVSYDAADFSAEVFFELLRPPMPVVIFGAGPDAAPTAEIAAAAGWRVTLVDPRGDWGVPGAIDSGEMEAASDVVAAEGQSAARRRFSAAVKTIGVRPARIPDRLPLDARAAAIVMTHNHAFDLQILRLLLKSPAFYIGMLGPRRRTEQMLSLLAAEGVNVDAHRHRVFGPMGLDVGADTPEAIAIAAVAEIQAVSQGRGGGFLRDRSGPIYPRETTSPRRHRRIEKVAIEKVVCPVSRS